MLELLLDIENAGGMRHAMAERVLARVCTVLSIRDITAELLFAELDTDGSGELDADELCEAFNHLGLSLSETAMKNVMMVFPHPTRLVV